MRLSRLLSSALLFGTAAVIISCAESTAPPRADAPTGTVLTAADLLGRGSGPSDSDRSLGLLTCTPLPAASASKVIGAGGGVIRVGPHTLEIPKNALKSNVLITAYAPSGTVNRVEFEPHGLEFKKPVALTMSYANCGLIRSLLPKHIAYVDGQLNILYLLKTVDDFRDRELSADIYHFSEYAVAW